MMRGIDPFDAKRNDLFLDLDQHPMKRLMIAVTELGLQSFQTRYRSNLCQQVFNAFTRTCNKQIDAFSAEQNCALQAPVLALSKQAFAQRL